MKTVFLMLKKKKRTKAALVLVLLFMPVLAYGVYLLALFLLDSFRGDGLILHRYAFESRHQLALQILSDSRQALPVFYAVTLLLWVEIYLLSRRGEWSGVLPAVLAGTLTVFAIAALLVEMSWGAIVPSVTSGLLLSLALIWALRPLRSRG
jgi:hypothetical protein